MSVAAADQNESETSNDLKLEKNEEQEQEPPVDSQNKTLDVH